MEVYISYFEFEIIPTDFTDFHRSLCIFILKLKDYAQSSVKSAGV